ncbi:MAG TPA: hypothetical protein VM101_03560 [Flavitalea sp.]|nr:hypothetical protein [Flavitalea sp.]
MFPRKTNFQTLLILSLILSFSYTISGQSTQIEKPPGHVWGYAFGDFFIKTGGDTARWSSRAEYSGIPKNVYAFAVRRMYLGYDYTISPKFSTSALLEGSDVVQTLRGERTVTIKALSLKWKEIYNNADLVIGQQSTLTFSFIPEKVWNYRSVEKTLTDARGIRSSSDMGLALYGRFDSLGTYGYNLMVGNGNGTRPEDFTEAGKHKVYYGELYAYLLERKLVLDFYADYQTSSNERDVVTLKGFAAYQTSSFAIGGELFTQTMNNTKSDGEDATPFGVSIFARASVIKDKLNVFARYDSFNPDNSYRNEDAITVYNAANMFRHYDETFFLAGLDYYPHKNVHIMPNIWVNTYSPKADAEILPEREADIVPRVTFYFIFR